MTVGELLLLFAVTAGFIWWLSMVAGRLDRVHIRRDEALTALRLQLAWRTSAVAKLLNSGLLDPLSAEVLRVEIDNVSHAAEADLAAYLAAESEMTEALCNVFDDADEMQELLTNPAQRAPLIELAAACRRVELARRFHNDAVGAVQLLRQRRVVRWFGLAGRTPWPRSLDLDDRCQECKGTGRRPG